MVYENTYHMDCFGKGRVITHQSLISSESEVIKNHVKSVMRKSSNEEYYKEINFSTEIPKVMEIKFMLSSNEEAYVIEAIDDKVNVYSCSKRGLLYGCNTLKALTQDGYLENMLVFDCPVCSVRGLKIYLPGEEGIEYFKSFIDMLCYFGYNTIMIEVGGAMEYKTHPEINQKWVSYCSEMREYSGKTKDLQDRTFKWYKNSMHVENGEGSYLSQEQVGELVQYCRDRYLDIIPEVPLLSHCDYLLQAHPELAERAEDPYPDTYCPSNPDAYKLVFNIVDEIIDVFKPQIMNIGHDEWYSIGICEKCRGKSPEKLFADDITSIRDYLAQKNIQTMIWGDKLLDARIEGKPHGGAETPMFQNYDYANGEYLGIIPATHKAVELVPKDLKILNWLWQYDKEFDLQYLSRGMDVVYGNFLGSECNHWKERLSKGIKGAIISNWSSLREENLQRNGVLFEIAYGTRMFWDEGYNEDMREEVIDTALKKLFEYKNDDAFRCMYNEEDNCPAKHIKVVHTTDILMEYNMFEDGVFIDNSKCELGKYIIMYRDGTRKELPIVYGSNISNCDLFNSYKNIKPMKEIAMNALPVKIKGKTYYEHYYINPYTCSEISGILLEADSHRLMHLFIMETEVK